MRAFSSLDRLYFLFDYISHNAYLAWHRVGDVAQRHGLTLEPVPVLFGAMLSHYRQVGPAEVPAKSRWMLRDVLRKARRLGIPIAPPASHPFNPLMPLRVTCAIADEAARTALIDRLFRAAWAERRPVADAATVAAVLREGGLDAENLLAQAQSEAVKQRLRQNTEDALAVGAFGVPTMLARGELFWGFDDLENLEMFLSGKDVHAPGADDLRPWLEVRPSVERRRP